MAKPHELAQRDYILGVKYREIAEKYNVSIDTVKSWKSRYKWEREKQVKKTAHNAHKNKNVCKQKTEGAEPEEELSEKEQLFCYHIVRTHGNATQAALLSGYSQNKACAQVQGSRLRQRPRVKQEIDRIRALIRQEHYVDIQDLIAFCLRVIGADVGDYLTWGQREVPVMGMFGPVIDNETKKPLTHLVNYVDLGESEMLDTSIIQEVKQSKDGVSIKLADKKWAWEQLIKFYDWLPDAHRRNIDKKKLELEKRRVAALENKAGGGGEDIPDDGFLEALEAKTPGIWGDDPS